MTVIALICFVLKAEYDNSNLDCIRTRQYLSRFDMSAKHQVLFCILSLSSVPAQKDGLILVIPVAPVARVAECRSPLQGSVSTSRI